MMATNELQQFIDVWDKEAQKTADLLRALPREQYDFRPDPAGRSLGELAWHLAEGDAYVTFGIEQGQMAPETRAPGSEGPGKGDDMAADFERVTKEALG